MRIDRWLWWLQIVLFISAPLLIVVAIIALVLVDGEVHYEHTYSDGTRVDTVETRDPIESWINFILLLCTALWQVGMGATLFCLRQIGHGLAAQRDADRSQDGGE